MWDVSLSPPPLLRLLRKAPWLKRPSNGAPEMKADRADWLACQDLLAFPALSLFFWFWPGTMSPGHGHGDESVAPSFLEASANNVDSSAKWGPASKAFPGCCTVCCRRALVLTGCQSYARWLYTAKGPSADLSHFGKLLEDSVQWRWARPDCRGRYTGSDGTVRLSLSWMLCSACCDLSRLDG